MANYKKLYYTLFRSVTKAIDALSQGNPLTAKRILVDAQIETEALFIEEGNPAEPIILPLSEARP